MTRRKSPSRWWVRATAVVLAGAVGVGAAGAGTVVPPSPQELLLAGHLLRRAGFGPSEKDMKRILKKGADRWIEQQLDPVHVGDSGLEPLLPPTPSNPDEDANRIRRWYVRMAYSNRQLQEKMTLIWHEHFAISNEKVRHGVLMQDYENLLRRQALGNFRDLLVEISKDQAMLVWLDNDRNSGTGDDPPNENYARELLQLFTMGTRQLGIDGTVLTDGGGAPTPSYSETDVKEVARALTGFEVPWPRKSEATEFEAWAHDAGSKSFLGATIPGRAGDDGANEVNDVIGTILTQRRDTVAAFIARILIGKLATETPSPAYVEAVATAFRDSDWSIREAVRVILTHPEFNSPAVIRSQVREPVEQFVGAIRGLSARTNGEALLEWTYDSGQLVWYPPSVFSFYPPGQRASLLDTSTVIERDRMADEFVRATEETWFDAAKLVKKNKLTTPEAVVDHLTEALIAAPLAPEVRAQVVSYMGGAVTEDKVRGAAWLLICSPDFQRN